MFAKGTVCLMHAEYLVGIDIGGTKCAVVLGRHAGNEGITISARRSFATETRRGPGYALDQFKEVTREILTDCHVTPTMVRGIGVCCGGPLDSMRGVILSPPNLPGWDAVPIVDLLENEFGVPAGLQNDANACALAEWRYGAGRGTRNMIFCTFGTGFGAGLILDGRLYDGTNGMAGEIGHVRLAPDGPVGYGKRGSVEGFCSGGGLAQLGRSIVLEQWQRGQAVSFCPTAAGLDALSARAIGEAARAGDPLARRVFSEAGRRLGQSLAILIDILNPEMIVIGSIYPRQQELLHQELVETIAEEALPMSAKVCRVVPAALGEEIGDYASLAVALNIGREGGGQE